MQRNIVVFSFDDARAARVVGDLQHIDTKGFVPTAVSHIEELRLRFARGEVDLLFADAQPTATAMDGISVARELVPTGGNVQTVFFGVSEANLERTCMAEHAYLLPTSFDASSLETAVQRAAELQSRWSERPVVLPLRRRDMIVLPGKVSYVESDRRKLRIHVGNEVVEVYGKLSDMAHMLPRRFIQCHKSFLVNMGFVQEVDREFVLLTTGERVPVSQKRRRDTRNAIVEYVGRSL